MGGKSTTSTAQTTIPPQVLAAYQSANTAAQQTAQTPFQQYGGQFVSPVDAEQQSGISATNQYAQEAQPGYAAATSGLNSTQAATNPVNNAALGLAGASAEQVNAQPLTGSDINQYLSPYLGDVLGTTNALANQNNSVAQSGALGTAISSGAFGGDRTGIAAANLNQQNSLAEQATDANILNTGYNTALSTAQQQQGVNLSAGQANRAALGAAGQEIAGIGSTAYGEGANTASELGALSSGAQAAGLSGAQAQIGAGTLQQQTSQAQDTAEYNQFLQMQSYPFQVDQFLANIAEGTGSLSGSTTTTNAPGGFFSDKRLKHDIKKIGKLFDGQEIYSYKMHGDPRTHIGLIAQKVEKKHPEAVGLAAGYKTVDYGKATEEAANRDHFRVGGNVVPIRRAGLAAGGSSTDLSEILAAQQSMYGNTPGGAGGYGLAAGSTPRGGSTRVPAPVSGSAHLTPAQGPSSKPSTGMQNVSNLSDFANKMAKDYQGGKGVASNLQQSYDTRQANAMLQQTNDQMSGDTQMQAQVQGLGLPADTSSDAPPPTVDDMSGSGLGAADVMDAHRGGRARGLYAAGGGPYSNDVGAGSTMLSIPTDSSRSGLGGAPPAAAAPAAGSTGGLSNYDPGAKEAIKTLGFDYGGSVPYPPQSNVPTSLDIPDDQTNRGLATAGSGGAGGGSSAGTQDAQDLEAVASIAAIAAAFMKRGGRIHKDDGGDVDGQDMLPDVEVDAQRPDPVTYTGGLAPPAAVPVDAPAPDSAPVSKKSDDPDVQTDHWYKHASNVVPLLEGLAAMGTAPTRHLGVALAAGLGAGAQSWLPAQQQQADIERTQQQGQQIGLQNKITQGAINASGSSTRLPEAVRPPGMVSGDPTDPQEAAFTKYAPVPTARPASVTQQVTQMSYLRPQAAKFVGEQYDNLVQGENQRRQIGANAAYQNALEISNAQPGQAFSALAKSNPQAASKLQDSTSDPGSLDQAAREYAQHVGLATHQYSNRPTDMLNGVLIDKMSGAPVLGSTQIMTGLTPEAKSAAYDEAITPKTYGAGLPEAPYKHFGFASPEAYVIAKDRASRMSGAPAGAAPGTNTGASPPPDTAHQPPPVSIQAPPPRRPVPQRTTAATPQVQPDRLPGVDINSIPKLPGPPPVVDQVSKSKADTINNANVKITNDALDSYNDQVKAAARNTAIYSQLGKKLATADPKAFGPTSDYYKAYQGLVTALQGGDSPNGLVNQAEVDKYLTMLGVGGSKQLVGSENQLRQQELLTLMQHANPNMHQPLAAVRALVAYGKANNEFDLKGGNTAMDAITNGADPRKVSGVVDARRSDYIQQALGTTPVRTGKINGKPVTQYADGTIR